MHKPCGTAELFLLTFSLVLIVKKTSAGLFPNKRQSFLKYFLFATFSYLPNVLFKTELVDQYLSFWKNVIKWKENVPYRKSKNTINM